MKRLVFAAAILLSFLGAAQAEPVHKTIYVQKIEAIETEESSGDEVYLLITELSPHSRNQQYTIPQYPVTWPSRALPQVANLKVWDGSLDKDEQSEVIVEVVEHDAPPFNADDSIGSARLKLKRINDRIEADWGSLHDDAEHQAVDSEQGDLHQYRFQTEDGHHYLIHVLVADDDQVKKIEQARKDAANQSKSKKSANKSTKKKN